MSGAALAFAAAHPTPGPPGRNRASSSVFAFRLLPGAEYALREIRTPGKQSDEDLSKIVLLAMLPAVVSAADSLSLFGISAGKNGSTVSVPMQIVVLLTLMTLLPAAVMCITPFLRITVVLHLSAAGVGTQSAPSTSAAGALAVPDHRDHATRGAEMYHQGWEPMESGQISQEQALDQASKPLRTFLVRFAREKDVRLFVELTHAVAPRTPADLDLKFSYRLHPVRAEDGFRSARCCFYRFCYRPGGGVGHVIDRHGSVATGDDLGSVQDSAVCAGDGWTLGGGSLMKSFYI